MRRVNNYFLFMTQKNIQAMLAELYQIDPSLKAHESQLIAVLEASVAAKPDVAIDERFIAELKRTVMERAGQYRRSPLQTFFASRQRQWAFGGAVGLAALVLVIGLSFSQFASPVQLRMQQAERQSIKTLAAGAFGSLGGVSNGAVQESIPLGDSRAMSSLPAAGFGGGSGMAAPQMIGSSEAKMIMPFVQYTYTYVGDALQVPADAPVYRRVKQGMSGRSAVDALRGVVSRLVNLGSFGNMNVQNIQLVEDTKDGYLVHVDFLEGRVNIQPNYQKWYMADQCSVQGCLPLAPVKESDIPDDATLIAIANDFLGARGIARDRYGAPVVDNQWRDAMRPMPVERGPAIAPYVPDVVSVVYPIQVEGHMVTEYHGPAYGLRVTIDVRKKVVQSVWNLTTEEYEKSVYALETDTARITRIAEQGGGMMYPVPEAERVTLHLGTPELVYVQHYLAVHPYDAPQELYMPAFRFPITNPPQDQPYFQKYITVPLAKEIIDMYDRPVSMPVDGPIHILQESAVSAPADAPKQ